jgi:hypothetical protein
MNLRAASAPGRRHGIQVVTGARPKPRDNSLHVDFEEPQVRNPAHGHPAGTVGTVDLDRLSRDRRAGAEPVLAAVCQPSFSQRRAEGPRMDRPRRQCSPWAPRLPATSWTGSAPTSTRPCCATCCALMPRRPPTHDHLFHTVLGLVDVRTALHEKAWDLSAECIKP